MFGLWTVDCGQWTVECHDAKLVTGIFRGSAKYAKCYRRVDQSKKCKTSKFFQMHKLIQTVQKIQVAAATHPFYSLYR